MSDTKKRTVYKAGSLLDMPEQILDRANYSYRWINAEKLAEASDGYEPRGWELFKDKEGRTIKRGDLILAQMPIDRWNSIREAAEEEQKNYLKLLLEGQAAQEEKLTHEFKKKGGRVKFEFTQE